MIINFIAYFTLYLYILCQVMVGFLKETTMGKYEATMLIRNYRHNYEKRCCSSSHKECNTPFKDHMVRLKIMSLYIYKDLRLRMIWGLMSHVTIIMRMATRFPVFGVVYSFEAAFHFRLRPKMNHFRILSGKSCR